VLHDGETVTLGGTKLTAHLTPGHTRGCTTWTLTSAEGGKDYNVVIVGSMSVNQDGRLSGDLLADFLRAVHTLEGLPCGVFLGAHGNYYRMQGKYAMLASKGPNPFIDPEGYRLFVRNAEKYILSRAGALPKGPR